MRIRSIVGVMVSVGSLFITGCNGPTKSGIENRQAAEQRMNYMRAQIEFDQARQCFESGQFEKAARSIDRAILANPSSAEYSLLQGRINLETHKLEPALDSFKAALAKDPSYAEAHYYSGIVYQRWSDDEKAYEHYSKAYELDPIKAQYLLAAAESLVAMGEFDKANELIEPKMDYFEHNAALRQFQGQIALLQGDPKKASALYGQARVLNPDNDLLLEELMWAQYAAEMYPQCHESVKQLQARSKNQRNELMHLEARCLTMMNRGTEARELYADLTQLRPSDATIWSELGALSWDLGDYRRVGQCSTRMISLAPNRYEGYMLKGVHARQQHELSEAVKSFRQAAQRAPDVALPRLLLGQTLEQSGDLTAAKEAYNDAINAEPSSTEAQDLLRRLNDNQRLSAAPAD